MIRESFISFDGKPLSLCIFADVKEPRRAVVQIAHGMAEHIERYASFAKFLNENGFIVAGDDHRAHGETDRENLGHCEGDCFADTVKDLRQITKHLKQRFNLPVILLGHSYGSFLTQKYIADGCPELAGAVLSGSALMKGVALSFGHFLAKKRAKSKKGAEGGQTFANLTFVAYDKKLKEGKNGWLTYEKENIQRYNADPLCGFLCSNNFYHSFFKGLKQIHKADFKNTDKHLKLLIVSGANDFVGGNGKLVVKLYKNYQRFGFSPLLKLYENMRHEILNEADCLRVYEDILGFINTCVITSSN